MAREDSFDLINLDGPLTVEAILKTLQQRFMDGHCYTWIGPVLLCINPFEAPGPAMHTVLKQLAERVLQDISGDRQPRAILFNGVSGSGKSFTSDQLLVKMFQNTQRTDWLQDIRKYWQVSTVVLKALGTACTEENKDSSRIGRIVDFQISGQKITKVKMNCFFLDQTRMVNPNPTDQNYHILYQMLAGLSPEERNKFMLNYHDVRTLHYLSQGTEPKESVPQLQSHFEAWKSSLAQLGIPLMDVLKVLAAVMLLGNTLFYEAKNQELSLQGTDELRSVATLLGVQPVLLQRGLTLRTYRSGRGQVVHAPCSAAAANGARDALAKALYIRTVVAIMRRINTLLRGASQKMQSSVSRHSPSAEEATLHVVDMFGYENCETNSLEQLCINWTAEKLQHYFTQSLFTATIKECKEEGVDPMFESALYNCSPCLELIGGQSNGMLEMLNEETLSPRVSSEDIRIRLREKFKANDRFIPPTGSSSTFAIRHFCGTVIYDTYSLLNANADTLADDVVATFNSKDCKFGFVAHLFAVELNRDLLADGTPRGQMCRITPAYLQHVSSPDSKQPTTYVQDFQSNVLESLSHINKAKPYFIQCMKSNSNQMAGHFDKEVVGQQVQHMAVFETVDFMQCAYTHWMTFEDFVLRYGLLSPDVVRSQHRKKVNETVERRRDMSCVTAGTCISALGKSKGHIQLILGPMFSGKTTELVRRMKRFQVANHSCLLIKYAKDKRYDKAGVATHDKQVTSAMATTELAAMKKTAKKYGVIGIDEGQFFPDIVEFCEEMANDGKMVIVAALDGTFQRKPFGPILDLVPLAESVIKLKAVCMVCFNDAAFTKRLGTETEVEVIGGADKYMAVCRSCYNMPDKLRLASTYSSPSPSEKTPLRGELTIGRQLLYDDLH